MHQLNAEIHKLLGGYSVLGANDSYNSYVFCYLNHINASESKFYVSKAMLMVIPKVVMGNPGEGNGNPLQYSCLDPDICIYSISIK